MVGTLCATTTATTTKSNYSFEVSSNFIEATNDFASLTNTEPQLSFSLLYDKFIPVIEMPDGGLIDWIYLTAALERLDNYPKLVKIANVSFAEIVTLKKINFNLMVEIDFRKAKEGFLNGQIVATQNFWQNQVKKERAIWFGIGAGTGAVVVAVLAILISSASHK